ncbi:MAG: DNA polymerase III subunit delta' [Proteobacteria bacterium]|nr:DNA polymerase III subunit delta' [Pseudomonadota bacterium]
MGFNEIIGHEKQKQMFLAILKRERLPHAFLFTGQEGIGKKKTAKEFAKHILCEKHNNCGVCRPCIKVERDIHPDVLIIENEDTIGIEQSRTIGREVYEYPYEGDKRIILIDRADAMTHEATNALLKTLEEPPLFNIFFLITSSERDVPLTIRSRCARVGFSPLSRERLQQYFINTASMDEGKAKLLSHVSQGSIGCGLFWMEKDHLLLRHKLAELIMGKDRSFIHTTLMSERISKSHRELTMFLSFLLSFFRDISVMSEYRDTSKVINRDMFELLKAESVDTRWIEASVRRIQETFGMLRYNINKLLAIETMLLDIMEQK